MGYHMQKSQVQENKQQCNCAASTGTKLHPVAWYLKDCSCLFFINLRLLEESNSQQWKVGWWMPEGRENDAELLRGFRVSAWEDQVLELEGGDSRTAVWVFSLLLT